MSIALSEFWTRLVRSGICDAEGCRRVASAVTKAGGGTPPSDAVTVAKFMVKRGKLTQFQARLLLANPARELRAGDYLIRSDQTPRPLSRWMEASRIEGGARGVLLRVPLTDQSQTLRDLLTLHQSVQHRSLQPLEVTLQGNSALLFSDLPVGECLFERITDGQSLPPHEVCQLGIALAGALEALHAQSLSHGQVRSDRVWISQAHAAMLLRDPSAAVGNAGASDWLDSLESSAFYQAPESQAGKHALSVAADLYSLGCLLFRLATGRYPYTGEDEAQILAAHHSDPPAELVQAVQQAEAGDPLFRVIAFAMAKSPQARFPSAAQLASALEATLGLLERAPETRRSPESSGVPKSSPRAVTPRSSEKSQSEATGRQERAQAAAPVAKVSEPKPRVESKASTPIPPPAAPPDEQPKNRQKDQASGSKRQELADRASRGGKSSSRRKVDDIPPAGATVPTDPTKSVGSQEENRVRSPSKKSVAPSDRQQAERQPGGAGTPTPSKPPVATSASSGPAGDDSGVEAEHAKPTPAVPIAGEAVGTADSTAAAEASQSFIDSGVTADGKGRPEADLSAGSLAAGRESSPPTVLPAALPSSAKPARASQVTPPSRRRRKKKSKAPLVLGGLCVAVLILLISLIAGDSSEPAPTPRRRPPPPSVVPPVTNRLEEDASGPSAPSVNESVAGYQLVSDDRLLFVPPYSADSPSAPRDLLPPGPAVLLSTRLAGVVQDPTGAALIAGMSPELQALIQSAADRAKLPVNSIQRLTVAMHPGEQGWPEVSLAVELEEPIQADTLIEKLGVDAARTRDNHTIYVGDEDDADAYYWPDPEGESIARYAVGSIDRISEVASLGGGAIPLPRSSQSLWDGASAESELVVLFTPNFLFADGRALLTAAAPEFIAPLKRLMQPNVAAALVTVNLSDQSLVFIEARFAPSGSISEAALMRNVTEAIQSWPDWADRFILESVPDASWRLLASRLPSMMRFVISQARFGISNGAVVANAYLPAEAFPQVALATLLAMNTPPTAGASTRVAQNQAPLTIEQMLDREMSVSFDQESLEFALEAIVNAFRDDLPPGSTMPPARIIGGDLQLMGITQNQQVRDFAKTNEPLRAVLTDLVVRANSDKAATGPADPKQALIWVVADDSADPKKKEILITTRQAAKSKNYELPKEFRVESESQ